MIAKRQYVENSLFMGTFTADKVGFSKYRGYMSLECEHLNRETMYERESVKLHDYFNA